MNQLERDRIVMSCLKTGAATGQHPSVVLNGLAKVAGLDANERDMLQRELDRVMRKQGAWPQRSGKQ